MWQLIKVEQTSWIEDDSGYYTLISWIDNNTVRLDMMDGNDENDPLVASFQGAANDVRKHLMQGVVNLHISHEHAAYIGAELARCELLEKDYIQN